MFKQHVQAIDTKLEEHLSAARDQSAMKAYWTDFMTEQLRDMQQAIGNDLDSAQQAFEDMSGRINGLLASARPVLVPTAGAHGGDYAAGLETTAKEPGSAHPAGQEQQPQPMQEAPAQDVAPGDPGAAHCVGQERQEQQNRVTTTEETTADEPDSAQPAGQEQQSQLGGGGLPDVQAATGGCGSARGRYPHTKVAGAHGPGRGFGVRGSPETTGGSATV